MINLSVLETEGRNQNTLDIDTLSTLEMVARINNEDQAVIDAISACIHQIAKAIDVIYTCIEKGGRLIYMGAGTSGRLGVLDASEWYPTYGVGEESVLGLIAGGDTALRVPIEGAEDNAVQGKQDLVDIELTSNDVVMAIASSGRTPYCIGALNYANSVGAKTVALACVSNSEIGNHAKHKIEAVVGPEVITGSTRMKSGSAQKMIINIISTSCMIKHGKVYGNLMVDVKPTNVKLVQRAKSIIMQATGCSEPRAADLLELSNSNVKIAVVMELTGYDFEKSRSILAANGGHIAAAIKE